MGSELAVHPWRRRPSKITTSRRPETRCCTFSKPHIESERIVGISEPDDADDSQSAQQDVEGSSETLPPKGFVLLDSLARGDKLSAEVLRVGPANSLWLKVNVVRRGRRDKFFPVDARLRFSLSLVKNDDSTITCTHVQPREGVGSKLSVVVKKVNVSSGRLEVERPRRPGVRTSGATNANRRRKPVVVEGGTSIESLEVGQKFDGRIFKLGHFGALIDCGVVRPGRRGRLVAVPGLMKRKHFPDKCASDVDVVFRDDIERKLCVGDEVSVYVRAAHSANGFLWLSGVPVTSEEMQEEAREWRKKIRRERRRTNGPGSLTVGEHVIGTVRQQVKYGAFVDIGLICNGLLHFTNMGKKHRDDWRNILLVNARIIAKVLSNTNDRIGLELIGLLGEVSEDESEQNMALARRLEPEPLSPGEQYQQALNDAVRLQTYAVSGNQAVTRADPRLIDSPFIRLKDRGRAESEASVDEEDDGDNDSSVDADDELATSDDFDDTFSDEYFEDKYNF
jgi:predicted RNA-binding protein with RPS1 domain